MTDDIKNLPALQKKAALLAKADEARKKLAAAQAQPKKSPATGGKARLLFAMDATASREPSWKMAQKITGDMFLAVPDQLEVQLAYYQGHDTFDASTWTDNAATFADRVARVRCVSGATQISRVLEHAVTEAGRGRLAALVLVGDAFEEEPESTAILTSASKLRSLGVKPFLFFEGDDQNARKWFAAIADSGGGMLLPFDQSAPDQLRQILAGIATFAVGGLPALEAAVKKALPAARLLLTHLNNE